MKTLKKAISILTVIVMLMTVIPLSAFAATNNTPFTDVGNTWYTEAVNYMYEHHYMSGTSSTKFSPGTTTTRAMFVTVLGRIAGIDANEYKGTSTFIDVPRDWAEPSIAWAASKGIVSGIGGNRFNPNGYITREQSALILYNYLKNETDYDLAVNDTATNNAPDKSNISSWALTAMNWAMTNKLIAGDTDGRVRPGYSATRAELAVILMRFDQYVDALESGSVDPNPTPTPSPSPSPAPCPDGEHDWEFDEPVMTDLDKAGIKLDLVEKNVTEWVFMNDARVMMCPCGLNTHQWMADHYTEYANAQELTYARLEEALNIECMDNHNGQVTKNMDTIWPAKYDKHYTNVKSSTLIVDQTCTKCGAKRSKAEPDYDLNAASNWVLNTDDRTDVSIEFGKNYQLSWDTKNGGTNSYINRDTSKTDGTKTEFDEIVHLRLDRNGNTRDYTYHHGPYTNSVVKTATNKVTGCTINVTGACDHAYGKWVRDWGDGSGYAGMSCSGCGLLVDTNWNALYN